jgi:hypothetical protein
MALVITLKYGPPNAETLCVSRRTVQIVSRDYGGKKVQFKQSYQNVRARYLSLLVRKAFPFYNHFLPNDGKETLEQLSEEVKYTSSEYFCSISAIFLLYGPVTLAVLTYGSSSVFEAFCRCLISVPRSWSASPDVPGTCVAHVHV